MIDPNLQAQANAENQKASMMATSAASLHIQSDDEYQQAAAVLTQIQAQLKFIEQERVKITKPLNDSLRAINALFKGPKQEYEKAKSLFKARMADFIKRKEEAHQASLQAAQQASDMGDQNTFYMQAQAAHDASLPHVGNVHTRDSWKFEVVNIQQVPLDFLMVDERKLRAFVNANKDSVSIPGVRVYKETQVIART